MRSSRWLMVVLVLASFLRVDTLHLAHAQEGPQDSIIGIWEETQGPGRWRHWTKFEFVEEGPDIKWRMERKNGADYWEVAGKAVRTAGGSFDLTGVYTSSTFLQNRGNAVRASVTRNGDELSGTFFGRDNTSWPLSLKKVK